MIEAPDEMGASAKIDAQRYTILEIDRLPDKAERGALREPSAGSKYSVEVIAEKGLSFFLFGQSNIPVNELTEVLNRYAARGWSMDFMFTERRRFLLFWGREAVIVVFQRNP